VAAVGGADNVYEQATANALSQFPEAELLVDVTMIDSGRCVEISGLPAKFRQVTPNTYEASGCQ
jgi:hypothetical protein